jgi:predicted nucleic acid-binding protein
MSDSDPRRGLVVDASVGIAIIRAEPAGLDAATILARHRASDGRLLVPDHFWIEIANVLARRYAATPEQIVRAFRAMDELALESVRSDRPGLLLSLELQHRHRLSAYDAIYLALAEIEDAQLVTLDERLADAAGDRAMRLAGMRPRRLAEERAGYGNDPIDWARFGPYLARLRAEAQAPPSLGLNARATGCTARRRGSRQCPGSSPSTNRPRRR